jgi:hypothetical protein
MPELGDIALFLPALSLAGQQVAEHLFGGFVKGPWMKYLAIVTTVGLAYAGWALGWGPMVSWDPVQVGVAGVLAGMGSNVLDAVLGRLFPAAKDATLSKAAAQFMARPAAPPGPPIPPSPGRR